ncbi:PadR family transcriptional regulator [Spirochaeta cellobiosiphila]|uniref:PadR family transcriptional regulator n=1 Tax=Spirochaeta cellobiosiphila TaxID=504483 RepID=UPI0004016DEA|nr:PadR family transcriptional regulator [Spirochaeta cellobiosiphila]
MNKLTYGLLSLLASESLTGYELTSRIKTFWHTNHSAIYPLLTNMVKNDLLSYVWIKQKGKPDKKLYSITEQGITKLKEWIHDDLEMPTKKDELTMRFFSIQILNDEEIRQLLGKAKQRCLTRIDMYNKKLSDLKKKFGDKFMTLKSPKIGSFLLLQKGIKDVELELEWCEWVEGLISKEDKTPIREL